MRESSVEDRFLVFVSRAVVLIGGTATASGDWTRESGGEIGSSGKSSRNFDIVRLGTFEVDLIGV
jgi:hypothetical protein